MKTIWFALLLAALPLAAAAAGEEPAAPPPGFAFSGMEMYKFSESTLDLRVRDLNGDGRLDLILVDNQPGKITFLLQRAPGEPIPPPPPGTRQTVDERLLEDTRFRKEGITSDNQVSGMDVGDLNGDGRMDIAFVGQPEGLVVAYQGEEFTWRERTKHKFDDPGMERADVTIGDFTGDGRLDVIALGAANLYLFPQDETGRLLPPRKLTNSSANAILPFPVDLNGDRRTDLVFLGNSPTHPYRYRLQSPQGSLLPEVGLPFPACRALHVEDATGDGQADIAIVDQRGTGRVRLAVWNREAAAEATTVERPFELSQLRLRPVRNPRKMSERCLAAGDVNGDQRPDLLLLDPTGARMLLYAQGEDGAFNEGEEYPGLAEAQEVHLADGDGDGVNEVLVLSRKEKIIGRSRWTPEGRLSFPQALDTEGDVLSLATGDLDGDGRLDLAYATAVAGQVRLIVLGPDAEGALVKRRELVPADLETDRVSLDCRDLDGDGRLDLLLSVWQRPLRVFRQEANGEFTDLSAGGEYRGGLVDGATAGSIAFSRTAKGAPALLFARQSYASALVLDGEGLAIADRYPGKNADAEIKCVAAADLDADGTPELVLLDAANHVLSLLQREETGLYRIAQEVALGDFDPLRLIASDLDGDGADDLVILGSQKFGVLYSRRTDPGLQLLAAFETEVADSYYQDLIVGDLNSDGLTDVVVNESGHSTLTFLTLDRENTLRYVMNFPVFEADPFGRPDRYRGSDVREMAVSDIDGDGREDLCLLIHDRVIIYLQRAPGGGEGQEE